MAESNIKKKIVSSDKDVSLKFHFYEALTGGKNNQRFLLYHLQRCIETSEYIDIVVSFLMESGVKMLIKDLQKALARGVKIRILTGNYLGITQPSALCMLKSELGEKIELRFYKEKGRSFHPKAYIFRKQNVSEMFIGSSNMSRSALTSGIEWNYHFDTYRDKKNFDEFFSEFENLFYNDSIIITDEVLTQYSKDWKRPALQKDLEKYDTHEQDAESTKIYEPRDAQIEALYALKNTRRDGAEKALIYAATGIGKTYLAAFDSVGFDKVLFVAHREEILKQAAVSFQNVRCSDKYGFFWNDQKDTDSPVVFASSATLGKEEYLNETYFARDYFDYIVVDEFHHAAADQYKRILDYFRPKFLLGLTATPERLDGKNIYELCDYNVPFQIGLQEGINKGYLVPFRYYGIFDETVDYSRVEFKNGTYDKDDLTKEYQVKNRYDLIHKHYLKYRSKKALGFCCSKQHAEEMAEDFCHRGVRAAAVYSNSTGEYSTGRAEALEKLDNGEINIIFSVNMFNEGVDISDIDMVMFLRPTESSTVFLQQLGRGLRKCKGKEFLNVLDFIGNYKKAGVAPFLLSGKPYSRAVAADMQLQDFGFPDDCLVDFDMRLIDLFQEMARREATKEELVHQEYCRIKKLLGEKIPSRVELFTYMEDEIFNICSGMKASPFKRYLRYLKGINELGPELEDVFNGIGNDFLEMLETTAMAKSYKMPVFLAFYNDGDIKMTIDEDDIHRSYKAFYDAANNWRDLERHGRTNDYKKWEKERYVYEAKSNPVKYLLRSEADYFVEQDGVILALNIDLRDVIGLPEFSSQMKDIIDYRTMNYYRRRYEKHI